MVVLTSWYCVLLILALMKLLRPEFVLVVLSFDLDADEISPFLCFSIKRWFITLSLRCIFFASLYTCRENIKGRAEMRGGWGFFSAWVKVEVHSFPLPNNNYASLVFMFTNLKGYIRHLLWTSIHLLIPLSSLSAACRLFEATVAEILRLELDVLFNVVVELVFNNSWLYHVCLCLRL